MLTPSLILTLTFLAFMPEHETVLIFIFSSLLSFLPFSYISLNLFFPQASYRIWIEMAQWMCLHIFFEQAWENNSVREKICGFWIHPYRLPALQGHWRTINWAYEPILPESFLNFKFRVIRHVPQQSSSQSTVCDGFLSKKKKQMRCTIWN